MDEDNKKLVEMAYDATAESAFVMLTGKAIRDVGETPGGQAHATFLLSRLSEPYSGGPLSEAEQDRLRTMQRLLVATVARFVLPELVENDSTQH